LNIRKKTNQSRVLNSFFFIQTGLLTYLLTRAASKAEVRYITIKSVLAASRTFSCSDVSLEVLAQVSAQKYRQYFLQKCLYWYRQYFQHKVLVSLLAILFASIVHKPDVNKFASAENFTTSQDF